ncbi:uncharacterized protein EKO05_0007123 [Ascochyta rabiei]|uniref:uncharacterized protein n=1 Tax=Didymella rabiei TaxID=5454 RepID=UPI0021FBCF77|nr:uncharacterized protein EKO05_0007123 [Ascochyta rabiei]UPX16736.1 hypothetical protein EKO05_0007123 [Ascochyta rabiei]
MVLYVISRVNASAISLLTVLLVTQRVTKALFTFADLCANTVKTRFSGCKLTAGSLVGPRWSRC